MVAQLNGAAVISVTAQAWREADQSRLIEGARIVSRALVRVDGGGQFNGLVVTKRQWDPRAPEGFRDIRWVVVWERDGNPAGVFRALVLDGDRSAI